MVKYPISPCGLDLYIKQLPQFKIIKIGTCGFLIFCIRPSVQKLNGMPRVSHSTPFIHSCHVSITYKLKRNK